MGCSKEARYDHRLGSNRFRYTTFTAGPMNFSHQCLLGMFGCEQRLHTVYLLKESGSRMLMGDDFKLEGRGEDILSLFIVMFCV